LIISIADAHGRPYRVAGLAEDITSRKQADEQNRLLQSELAHLGRLTVAGEMASGLAHELNQPLTAISTYAETCKLLLDAKQPSSEDLHTTATEIAAQSRRAAEIIRRMRDFTRRAEPQRAPADINRLIREMVRFCETEAKQRATSVRLDIGDALPSVFADTIQIQQVVLNLMRNGIEAMEINDVGERNLVIRTTLAGSHLVEVAVADSGPGLTAAAQQQLFHPFFTTKSDGMGLGLSISRSIVEAHDGRLWVTPNAPRPGVTFHFTLPAVNFGQHND
jgi:two-component system sensor kinase FixL